MDEITDEGLKKAIVPDSNGTYHPVCPTCGGRSKVSAVAVMAEPQVHIVFDCEGGHTWSLFVTPDDPVTWIGAGSRLKGWPLFGGSPGGSWSTVDSGVWRHEDGKAWIIRVAR